MRKSIIKVESNTRPDFELVVPSDVKVEVGNFYGDTVLITNEALLQTIKSACQKQGLTAYYYASNDDINPFGVPFVRVINHIAYIEDDTIFFTSVESKYVSEIVSSLDD